MANQYVELLKPKARPDFIRLAAAVVIGIFAIVTFVVPVHVASALGTIDCGTPIVQWVTNGNKVVACDRPLSNHMVRAAGLIVVMASLVALPILGTGLVRVAIILAAFVALATGLNGLQGPSFLDLVVAVLAAVTIWLMARRLRDLG